MYKLDFHDDSKKSNRGRGRGRGSSGGLSRGRPGRGTGRLPNRPPRSDTGNWRDGRGGGGNRRGSSFPKGRPPKPEETKVIEVQVQDVIYHAFLPKILPQNAQEHLVDVEDRLMEYVISGIADSIAKTEGFKELDSAKRMMDQWKEIQPKWRSEAEEDYFAVSLKQAILNQAEGEIIPVYIRKQNCTLLISKLDETFTQLLSFRAMLSSETVMSSVGSLTMTFPQTCDPVYNKDLFVSDIFLYHLHQLAVEDFELSLPCTKKGEVFYTDYRDVPDPFLVSDFFIGALVPAKILYENDKLSLEQIKITKKIRDHVTCEMSSRATPFRRSGLWLSVKVALQLKLIQDVGDPNIAGLLYKLIMLRVLAGICQEYAKECINIDLDLSSQLLAKLANRVSKLKLMPIVHLEGSEEVREKILLLKQKTLEFCYSVVSSLQNEITGLWRRVASTHSVVKPIVRSNEDFQKDLRHEVQWLDQHIQKALPVHHNISAMSKQTKLENLQKADALRKSPDFLRSLLAKRYGTLDAILKHQHAFNSQYSDIDDIRQRIWVYDTEYYIKYKLDERGSTCSDNTEHIQNLILAYLKNAVPRYISKNDPNGYSQMILVILKAIETLDKICTEKYSLLLQYKSGINVELFNRLLLPHQQDIQLLDEVSDYFSSRNENAQLPSLIENNRLDMNSFPVCFAEQNEEMRKVRQRILNDTEAAENAKVTELKRVRLECEEADRQLRALGGLCKNTEMEDGEIHDNKRGSRSFASITCRRCKINSILRVKRQSVRIYERPLPKEEYLQYAVIFELKIPPEISLLRDLLALLKFEVMGQRIFGGHQIRRSDSSKPPPNENWREYMKRKGPTVDYKSSSILCIDLVSPRLPTLGTCVAKLENPDVLVQPLEKFIVNNDLDCVYYHEKPLWFPNIKNSANICVFQLDTVCQPDALTYSNLQWTVGSTKHPHSQVIAQSQVLCHRQLSPEEYTAFGTVRADGDRIQIRNLYREIYDRTLSLQKEPVLLLILQVLWQVGPRGENGIRELHEDFLNSEFSLEFMSMLDALADTCEGNYSEPLILMIVVIITVRILEINVDGCQEMCYNLLRKSRNVIKDWVDRIEQSLVKSAESEDHTCFNFLKARLLEATICSVFTYHVSSENLVEIVIQSEEDYVCWLHSVSRLHQLTEEEQCHKNISQFAKTLLNIARNIPLKLELEKHLKSDKTKNLMLKGLHLFTCERWSKVKDCISNSSTWKIFSEKENPHVIFGGYEEARPGSKVKTQHFLSLDLIQGTFLVNGFPPTTLPFVIRSHPLFKRYFKDSKFRIQRYSTCARTVDTFHGRYYDFELTTNHAKEKVEVAGLVIREIQEDNSGGKRVLEMLESVLFRNVVGSSFVDNYTHWLDTGKREVYFRRLPKKDSDYTLPYDYVLQRDDTGNWKMYARDKKYLLSIRSSGFNLIAEALSRLESKDEINILMDIVTGSVTAKLPRYNISFNLIGNVLHSVEYANYRISENQNLGTLIGLYQGLLLEFGVNPDKYSKRLLIVPHGYLCTELMSLKYHHNTTIDLNNLRQPRFFVYDYDTVLRQLKADKSLDAWLHLAALHATTSSSLPDPFTQITGTERALEILKSGHVWPTQPYDAEALETLELIRDLAPRRSYYAHGISFFGESSNNDKKEEKGPREKMEITQWRDVVPSLAAHDAYPFIVDRLIESSGVLSKWHGENTSPQKVETRKYHKRDDYETAKRSEKLQLRSYQRHLSFYNQAAILPSEFFKKSCQEYLGTGEKLRYNLRSTQISSIAEGFCLRELQIISQTRLVNTFEKNSMKQWQNSKCDLESYLISDSPIAPLVIFSASANNSLNGLHLKDLLNMEFTINWLQLYAWAINKSCGQGPAFTIVLCALAYRGEAPLPQIMHLHHISKLAETEEFPEVPAFASPSSVVSKYATVSRSGNDSVCEEESVEKDLIVPTDCVYEPEEIQTILESNMTPLDAYGEEGPGLDEHLANVRADAIRIATELRSYWPCQSISKQNPRIQDLFKDSSLRFRDGLDEVNKKIAYWYRNQEFNNFVEKVQSKLTLFLKARLDKEDIIEEVQELYNPFKFLQLEQTAIQLNVIVDGVKQLNLFEMVTNLPMLDEANIIFQSGQWPQKEELAGKDFTEQRNLYEGKIEKLLQDITLAVQGADDEIEKKIVYRAGVAPRVKSTMILQFLNKNSLRDSVNNNPLWIYVGALGVLWTHLKRLNRCIALQRKGDTSTSDANAEQETFGHDGWSPKHFPEWLLLELELDIMIKRKQFNVALQMMRMPDEKNGVMQLNMGEGKTSVIVPMLCATLSSENVLCRVTILSSIFKSNLNILRFAIGGLLNRRVYTFPCKRNIKLDMEEAKVLMKVLEECLMAKGVLLTVPEHRFSFRLLALDKIMKREFQLGEQLLHIENWLRYFCRDILDESDELFNVKYQLVYSCGTQSPVDGDSLRWTICQEILNSVKSVAGKMQSKYGNSAIEFDKVKQSVSPEQFTTCRLLTDNDECLDELKDMIAEDLLTRFLKFDGMQRRVAKLFMTQDIISEENHDLILKGLQDKPELLNKLLLVSAYLRREILAVALRKRWRVEYGVNPTGERLMAVPFRAKDAAVERNEFGHPDLAIVLTHLSYYYSGLNSAQLKECFELLKNKRDGEEIYDYWVGKLLPDTVPANMPLFQQINLTDTDQSWKLFKILRMHKDAIDFWLSYKVFPRESMQFPSKIFCTGWDLCHERNRFPITGFSGTNDTKDLLPLTTSQQDLEELMNTNEEVEEALLYPRNNENHKGFRMGVTCQEILTALKNDSMKILIDAGAIMLECDNEQVADLWLGTDSDIKAVIYFDPSGEAVVKCRGEGNEDDDRGHIDVRLEESPFKYNLGECGVFLDDQHTRGVDFKFPDKSRACVTIGSRMKREKLVQACLRMRKLLSGQHSVTFYLSHEAHGKVNGGAIEINTEDVLDWVRQNTLEFNQDGLPYLCLNGLNYVQKLVAEDLLNFPSHAIPLHSPTNKSNAMLEILAKQCSNDEVTKLMDMYGEYSKRQCLVDVIPAWFEMTKNRLIALNGNGSPLPAAIVSNFGKVEAALVEKCVDICKDRMVFSSCGAHVLEEEQEKELQMLKETEVEEEREVQRAGPPAHVTPHLHDNVKLAILKGNNELKRRPGIVLLSEIFKYTTFWKDVQPECWGEQVYVTEDFARVIQTNKGAYSSTNLYLRPIHWVASQKREGNEMTLLLVLSPFEVNEMMPFWRNKEAAMQLHMFCRRRFQNQDLLINKTVLVMPSKEGSWKTIQTSSRALACLSVASASLYFGSDKEKEVYIHFLSVRQSRKEDEEEDGDFNFKRDPTQMVKNILSSRHPIVSQVSHVIQTLDEI